MPRDQMLSTLQAILCEIVEGARGKEVLESMSMKELGADSLEIVEVASRTMKELRIRVPRTELSQAKTIGQLLDLLEKTAAAKAA